MKFMKTFFLGMTSIWLGACVSFVSLSPQDNLPTDEISATQADSASHSLPTLLESGEEFLKNGSYKEALEEFKAALKVDRSNESAQKGAELARKKFKAEREKVVQSLLQLKETGFELYQREEYVRAGQSWKEAIQLFEAQKDPTFPQDLAFNPNEILAQMEQVIQILLEKGIFLYRQGKLEAAISVWQDVLMIDPQQRQALDYINKAQTKIETLENLSSTSAATFPGNQTQIK